VDASGNAINIDAGGEYGDGKHPFDREIRRKLPVKLVNHEIA
jgi:hypothetical protein